MSGLGDGAFWVALVVSLADEARFGLLVTLAVVIRLGPRAALSYRAGVLADRVDVRALLVGVDLVRGVAMAILAVVSAAGAGSAVTLALMLVSYVAGVPTRPALSAALPRVSGEGRLAHANATLSTLRQTMTFVGPFVGVIVVGWSVEAAFALNAASFVASALLYAATPSLSPAASSERAAHLRSAPRPDGPATTEARTELGARPGLLELIALVGGMYFVRGAEMVLYVLVVRDVLDADPAAIGYLGAAVGLGALVAMPLAPRATDRQQPVHPLVVGIIATVVPTAALAFVGNLAAAVVLLVPVGVGMVLFEVIAVSSIQRVFTPDRLGRAFGAVNTASNSGKLLGAVLAPMLAALIGTSATLVVVAAGLGALTGSMYRPVRRITRDAVVRGRVLAPTVDVLGSLALFQGASRIALEQLASVVHQREVAAGTVLIREHEAADDLYVARSGEFDVTVGGERVNTMGAGDWFGEIGLVDRVRRTATVTARTDAVVWQIPGATFLAVLEDSGSPPSDLVEGIAARLATARAG
jgi:predicted MFS family arabinose efflux permease